MSSLSNRGRSLGGMREKPLRPRAVAWAVHAAALGAILACLAGCGDSSGTSSTTTPTGTTHSSQTAASLRATGSPVVVASGIPFAANLAFDARGRLWVVSLAGGPSSSDGVWYVPPGGRPRHVAAGLTTAGLTWVGNSLYVSNLATPGTAQVVVLDDFTGSGFRHRRVLSGGLPSGSHPVGSVVQGPGGRIYVGLGSLEDHSGPPGRVMSFAPSGGAPVLAATGLRTAFGLAFWGRRLLVTDNGADGVSPSPDELQAFEPGGSVANFGFPKCYGQGGRACAGFRAPLITLAAHSTPEGIAVKGGVAYIAESGSAVPGKNIGSKIVRVDLRTGRVNVFWRATNQHDLLGLAIGPDGNLYATLYTRGQVVRFDL